MDDYSEPDNFNATTPMSRKDFYALNFRVNTPVQNDFPANMVFLGTVGITTEDSVTPNDMMASHMQSVGYINGETGGMTAELYNGDITKLEAVYLVMNNGFGPELANLVVDGTELKGVIGGVGYVDFANRLGLVEKDVDQNASNNWRPYALMSMNKNPKNGFDMEMYKTLFLAHELGIVDDTFLQNLGQPISREESLQLMFNFGFAVNDIYGYATTVADGVHNKDKFFQEDVETTVIGGMGTEAGDEVEGDTSNFVTDSGEVAAMTQEDFDLQFGEDLTAVAKEESMTVDERKASINEVGAMFSCDVSKYIAMIPTGTTGSGTTGSGQGGTTTTTPPVKEPPVTPPVTPPKTTPPATSTPGAKPSGDGSGGTSTEGLTDDEMDNIPKGGFEGTRVPGTGGTTSNPDDKFS